MMSYVIDLGNEPEFKGYILRLRGTTSEIVDLAGNNIINHGVDHTSVPSTLGNGKALKFSGSQYIETFLKDSFGRNEDFTISFHIIESTWQSDGGRDPIISSLIRNDDNFAPQFTILLECTAASQFYYGFNTGGLYTPEPNPTGYEQLYNISTTKPATPCHVAFVMHNNILKCYYRGQQLSQTYDHHGKRLHNKAYPVYIGYTPRTTSNLKYLRGTLDDLCIIKGKALWTSNFTPPTSYLPDYEYL